MSDPPPRRLTIGGYPVELTHNLDGGMTLVIDLGWLGSKTLVISGEEWLELMRFQAEGQ